MEQEKKIIIDIAHNVTSLKDILKDIEKRIIKEALWFYEWNLDKVCKNLQISKQSLYNIMRRENIKRPGSVPEYKKSIKELLPKVPSDGKMDAKAP